ncbi:acyl-CoA thioesterase [Brumimicrobium aurantiacum]|uniref:Acyl-CoA thioesterase n=1 Tax=Brumimicrobium aurantiacum TaxID=1737063 RepID=A0A3E1EZZ5_9FLAO|nr:thioesterase family protein [Brumimicrobium aurantiacum]RFC55125.1 acyl-CoA thioesterase [Brumimicrobium aurantiacum]
MIKPARIQVRFADCDMMGHVNNAVYLSYFEQARMHYFEQLVGSEWDYQKQGTLLVKNELTYLKPVFLHDFPEISLHLIEVGGKSFTFGYEVRVDGELRTTGASKLVCFDFRSNKSVEVFPELIEAFKKLDDKT